MGMAVGQSGKKGRATPQVNVTPLVDVALVVLIIFMVVTPLMTKEMWLNIPKPPDDDAQESSDEPVVLTVDVGGTTAINRKPIPRTELGTTLAGIFANRRSKVLHVDAADTVPYGELVTIVDEARGSGAKSIAVATKRLE